MLSHNKNVDCNSEIDYLIIVQKNYIFSLFDSPSCFFLYIVS